MLIVVIDIDIDDSSKVLNKNNQIYVYRARKSFLKVVQLSVESHNYICVNAYFALP